MLALGGSSLDGQIHPLNKSRTGFTQHLRKLIVKSCLGYTSRNGVSVHFPLLVQTLEQFYFYLKTFFYPSSLLRLMTPTF